MSRKRKAKSTKITPRINSVIGRARNETVAQHRFFSLLSPKEIYQNFRTLKNHPYFSQAIRLTKTMPVREMYKYRTLRVDIEKNLAWCLALIDFHAISLRKYNALRESFDKELLSGNTEKAIELLDEIDNECGVSVWSYITRTSIEGFIYDDELEKNDSFGSIKNNNFLSYVAFYSGSYFTDPEIFTTSKNTHINDIKRSLGKELSDFFIYRFFRLESSEEVNFESILDIEKNSSIVDIFSILVSILEYSVVKSIDFESNFGYRLEHVTKALEKTGYNYIGSFNSALGFSFDLTDQKEQYIIIDEYTKGNYKYVINKCLKTIHIYNDFSFAELAARAAARSGETLGEGFIANIVDLMSNVLSRGERYDSSLGYLSCLSNSFRTIEWFKQLGYFVDRESRNRSSDQIKMANVGQYLYSRTDSPKRASVFSSVNGYKESVKGYYKDSISVKLFSFSTENHKYLLENCLDKDRLRKYEALKKISDNEFYDSEIILVDLVNKNNGLIKSESLRIYSDLLMKSAKLDELIELVVDNSINGDYLFSVFDTEAVIDLIEQLGFSTKSINLPVLYSLHSQYINSSFDSNLKFSFENFLVKNEFEFPTELFDMEEKFTKKKLEYFLRFVCTPDVMKLYLNFKTYRDIEECRLKICNYLLDKNSDLDEMQFELKNISKNLIIRKAVQQVENSRIYVDPTIFKGRSSAPYKALFERYLDLSVKRDSESSNERVFEKLLVIFKKSSQSSKEFWKSLSMVFLPDERLSPKNATFLSLVKLMRQEFTYGEKGINSYLSTRIRHGVLPTAIRRSSMSEGLYISDAETVTNYLESKYEESNFQLNEEDAYEFLEIAKKFTRELEEEISSFNDNKLQIYTLESPLDDSNEKAGMFNYSISPLETYALQSELPPSPAYEDLVNVITDWLWQKTDYILDEVKDYIQSELHLNLNEKFDKFSRLVQESPLSQSVKGTLANAISRAKSSLNTELETISSWFEHVDSEDEGEFELSTAIETARRSLGVDVKYNEHYIHKMPQKNVSYWVDVFFILFENALSKSQLEKTTIFIEVNVDSNEENELTIECKNNIKKISNLDSMNADLRFYKEAYGDESLTKDAIQSEGGTGFFKIWKIVAKDLGISHEIDFNYETDSTFIVKLVLKL